MDPVNQRLKREARRTPGSAGVVSPASTWNGQPLADRNVHVSGSHAGHAAASAWPPPSGVHTFRWGSPITLLSPLSQGRTSLLWRISLSAGVVPSRLRQAQGADAWERGPPAHTAHAQETSAHRPLVRRRCERLLRRQASFGYAGRPSSERPAHGAGLGLQRDRGAGKDDLRIHLHGEPGSTRLRQEDLPNRLDARLGQKHGQAGESAH